MEDQEPQEEGSEQPGHLAAKSPPSPEDLLAQDIANLWLAAPGYQVSSAVIWLHHQGESEAMQEMLFRNFQLPEEVGRVRWLWPRAPLQPSSIRGHSPTLQWFDVKEYPICRVVRAIPDRARKGEDEHDVSAAVKRAETMVRALEVEGIPRRRILLGGFGQGAALVLRTESSDGTPTAAEQNQGGCSERLLGLEDLTKHHEVWFAVAGSPVPAMFQTTSRKVARAQRCSGATVPATTLLSRGLQPSRRRL